MKYLYFLGEGTQVNWPTCTNKFLRQNCPLVTLCSRKSFWICSHHLSEGNCHNDRITLTEFISKNCTWFLVTLRLSVRCTLQFQKQQPLVNCKQWGSLYKIYFSGLVTFQTFIFQFQLKQFSHDWEIYSPVSCMCLSKNLSCFFFWSTNALTPVTSSQFSMIQCRCISQDDSSTE